MKNKNKSAWQLRAFRAAAVAVLSLSAISCTKDLATPACITGDCDAQMIFPVQADRNGYYTVELDWSGDYLPYFTIDVVASKINPEYFYNGIPYASAVFESDTWWTLGNMAVFQEPLYNPFTGDYTSSGTMLPTNVTYVELEQYKDLEINIVQNTEIFFSDGPENMVTRRTVGPIPPTLKGDTITLFMEVFWDAGSQSIIKSNFSEKFIVK